MLSGERVKEVKEMLASGLYSQRTISRLTGVSRVVIHRIATGKRKDKIERPREEWEEDWTGRPFQRCPHCGAKVQLPCLACIIRNVLQKSEPSVFRNPPGLLLHLELEERHRVRYEQVKAWREAQKNPDFVDIPEDWPFRKRFKKAIRRPDSAADRSMKEYING